jgi:hypothetical protein
VPKTLDRDKQPGFPLLAARSIGLEQQRCPDFSRFGKPTEDAFPEWCNAKVAAAYVDRNWFWSLDDARFQYEPYRR